MEELGIGVCVMCITWGRIHGGLSLSFLTTSSQDQAQSFRTVHQGTRLPSERTPSSGQKNWRKGPLGNREQGRFPQKEEQEKGVPNFVCGTLYLLRPIQRSIAKSQRNHPVLDPQKVKQNWQPEPNRMDCLRKSTQNKQWSILSKGDSESHNIPNAQEILQDYFNVCRRNAYDNY